MSEPIIRLRGLTREFTVGGRTVHALRGVDLDIAAGELIALMGPSGSGKSTLLNILGCLDRPTAGSYVLHGRETAALSEDELVRVRRQEIGFVFQMFHLVPRMTALRNVELPMIFGGLAPFERRDKASRALTGVGLEPRMHHRPNELSGGERQRVAIARALVMDPSVLLADEPTGNLDSGSGAEIIRILVELNRGGRTIIVVTHNPEVAAIGHRVLCIRDGNLT